MQGLYELLGHRFHRRRGSLYSDVLPCQKVVFVHRRVYVEPGQKVMAAGFIGVGVLSSLT